MITTVCRRLTIYKSTDFTTTFTKTIQSKSKPPKHNLLLHCIIPDHPIVPNLHNLPHPNIFKKRHFHHRSRSNPSHDFPRYHSSPVLPAARSRKPQVGYTGIEFWAATADLELGKESQRTTHPLSDVARCFQTMGLGETSVHREQRMQGSEGAVNGDNEC